MKDLETFLMTDQPPTCPKCGVRVNTMDGIEAGTVIATCPLCGFKYNLEQDTDEGQFYVQMKYASGWGDAQWTVDDQPQRFDSDTDCEAAIDEFIREQHEAVAAGDMPDKHNRADYRAAIVKIETN